MGYLRLSDFHSGRTRPKSRVIDGDTLDIDGTTYRLNSIDAPEHGQKCGKWRCGAAGLRATDNLAELVSGAPVACACPSA